MRTPRQSTAASVRQRLHDSGWGGGDFNFVLTRYASERLLYRLSQSPYADQFVLKGATLFALWTGTPYRPTRDLDLLSSGDDSPEHLAKVFADICRVEVEPDGLSFEPESVNAQEIREEQEYGGVRMRMTAWLENARIGVQVDIGFGDAVNVGPPVRLPTILVTFQPSEAF